jgi:hypothetical protein
MMGGIKWGHLSTAINIENIMLPRKEKTSWKMGSSKRMKMLVF